MKKDTKLTETMSVQYNELLNSLPENYENDNSYKEILDKIELLDELNIRINSIKELKEKRNQLIVKLMKSMTEEEYTFVCTLINTVEDTILKYYNMWEEEHGV